MARDMATAPPAQRLGERARALSMGILREPLFHFLVIGLTLFAAVAAYRRAADAYRIEITPGQVRQLATNYRLQFGEAPSPAARARLIDKYVDEEVLYRQGLALKLDHDDEIVRRRIVQKMQFLQQDLQAPAESSPAQLQGFFQVNRARYATPPRVAFSHIYFSPDRAGADDARRRAEAALAGLGDQTTRAPKRGDNFPDLYDYADLGPDQVRRLFGDTPLARVLFTAPVGRWVGPYRSAYGWHLIRIQSRRPAMIPALSEIADQVRADKIAADQTLANRRAFEALKARFTIVRDDLAAAPPSSFHPDVTPSGG